MDVVRANLSLFANSSILTGFRGIQVDIPGSIARGTEASPTLFSKDGWFLEGLILRSCVFRDDHSNSRMTNSFSLKYYIKAQQTSNTPLRCNVRDIIYVRRRVR